MSKKKSKGIRRENQYEAKKEESEIEENISINEIWRKWRNYEMKWYEMKWKSINVMKMKMKIQWKWNYTEELKRNENVWPENESDLVMKSRREEEKAEKYNEEKIRKWLSIQCPESWEIRERHTAPCWPLFWPLPAAHTSAELMQARRREENV